MNFIEKAQLINIIVQEVVDNIIPNNWNNISFYTERMRDENLGLRNKTTIECWVGVPSVLYTKDYALNTSGELLAAIDSLYLECEKDGDIWSGFLLTINNRGKYSSKFYYEGVPLIDGNDAELSKRLAEINP
ncbi:immunity protein YezG family protein [Acinetobacter sp. WCHAc010052]|uniref:immunity protein YezG family protein n=1 Tax=Acinetobacter sp. WCHAc010052 TaxID=2004647 RepID=UPI000B3D337B|nr:immunity protein YezG family protein [Acinetobacter sp. WCHAc010052]AXY60740.1 DUF600 family protein [Acinetobacter sp. WCHAc010052]